MLRVVRVLAPNPGPFTLEGTNTWIIGRDPAAVIDPGPLDHGHVEAVGREAGAVGAILVSHAHPDHAPAAAPLAELTGAPVLAFRPGQGQERIRDEQVVEVGGNKLTCLRTPGHSSDHIAFFEESAGALFTGDAVLGRGTTVIAPPDGDLAAYVRSLHRMKDLKPRTIYPGHGPTVFDARAKLDEYIAHRAMREEQVLEALRTGRNTIDEMVASIYVEYPAELHPAAAQQVAAQLTKLEREGRVARSGRPGQGRFELVDPRACERCGRLAMPRSRLCRRCSLDALQEEPGR